LTSTSNFSSLVFDKFLSIPESMSTGFGLILRFTSFRLELNYCIPLKSNLWDSVKPGFQIGIGMHFM
jgi:outer membrane protein assembly factor BamA